MDLAVHEKITILGFGVEGQSFYRFYRKQFPTKELYIADQHALSDEAKTLIKDDANIVLRIGQSYLDIPHDSTLIIKTPGLPFEEIEYDEITTSVTTVTNLFLSAVQGKVIGITGTKGKSTTSKLIYEILKAAQKKVFLLGNIGEGALDYLQYDAPDTWYVYEMSSYQCDTLIESPHVAVMLNIFPEHISYHGSFKEYIAAKTNITKYQDTNDFFIYFDDEIGKSSATQTKAQKISFSVDDERADVYIQEDTVFFKTRSVCDINGISLKGQHQYNNILAAVAVGKVLNISDAEIKNGLQNMKPLEYRLEEIPNSLEMTIVDDTLATIPQATIAALKSLQNVQTLIIGGMNRGEEIDYTSLAEYLIKHPVKNLIIFPETGKIVLEYLRKKNSLEEIHILETASMQEAVVFALGHTSKGGTILHSPGASSFNLFKNYKDRSKQFRDAIKTYEQNHKGTN